jgi:ubiquinone/menaquinone biosynthesis C-methylase UbiE
MSYDTQKEYFQIAYNTGTDNWTHKKYRDKLREYALHFPANAMVLDIGCGRGLVSFFLAELGYRVIGLDYIPRVIEINNKEVKAKHLAGRVAFMAGDVFNIPLADSSIDAVTDIGLLHHIKKEDWVSYVSEITRTLKPGGMYLTATLSKDTPRFFEWLPKQDINADYEKYGAHYHFFKRDEVTELFGGSFELIHQNTQSEEDGIVILFTLLKKRN